MSTSVKAGFVSQCVKPIGRITYRGDGGYTDTQMIMPGRTPEELIAKRFATGRLPDGWTTEVVYFGAK